jgi:predicted P-loop ATPase
MGVTGKEALEQIQGVWGIEMAELAGLRKAEVESIKHFISKQEDVFRPAYARTSETFKRQCVFFGTTNDETPLKDPTGNRRFNPAKVRPFAIQKDVFIHLDAEVDQIWAEAVALYKSGAKRYLSKEAEATAKLEQVKHSEFDERRGLVEQYLDMLLPEDWDKRDLSERRVFIEMSAKGTQIREKVCIAELWCECLGKEKENMTKYNTRDVNDIMKGLSDWESGSSTSNFSIYGKQRFYQRKI